MFGPPQLFTTHRVLCPSDRTVIAACSEVGCLAYRNGWDSVIDESTPLGQAQAAAIRSNRHGRAYRELPRLGGGPTVFRFAANQRCFAEHRTRPELYVVHAGTPEVGLGQLRRHARPDLFIEDYRETLDRRLTSRQKG